MENIEMERKFIVDYDNSFIQHLREHFPKQEIVQYYIKTNTRTVMRLRKITNQNDDVNTS
jgi:CYTH domain-containing protein